MSKITQVKVCTKCKIEKSVSEFYNDKSRNDGFTYRCKSCIREYCAVNKDKINVCRKVYRDANKEKMKAYRDINKDKLSMQCKAYKELNKDKIKAHCDANKDKRNKQLNGRYRNDIKYRLTVILRSRLHQAIKRNYKSGSAVRDCGCSMAELKAHIESQFQPGMSWDNWSKDGFHIDHIIPLSSFDLSNREEFLKACHYSNLQPMWAIDNIKKSNKII